MILSEVLRHMQLVHILTNHHGKQSPCGSRTPGESEDLYTSTGLPPAFRITIHDIHAESMFQTFSHA